MGHSFQVREVVKCQGTNGRIVRVFRPKNSSVNWYDVAVGPVVKETILTLPGTQIEAIDGPPKVIDTFICDITIGIDHETVSENVTYVVMETLARHLPNGFSLTGGVSWRAFEAPREN